MTIEKALEVALDHCAAYKARQSRIVEGLGYIQKALDAGDKELAADKMRQLLEGDLKQARDRVHDWSMAISIAIKGMRGETDLGTALTHMKILVPDFFEKENVDNPIGFVENGKFVPG
jgi:hypothetical protein